MKKEQQDKIFVDARTKASPLRHVMSLCNVGALSNVEFAAFSFH